MSAGGSLRSSPVLPASRGGARGERSPPREELGLEHRLGRAHEQPVLAQLSDREAQTFGARGHRLRAHRRVEPVEIARSEQTYTYQRPMDFATSVYAGAVAAGWRAPVFVQGDHYQFNAKKYADDPEAMTEEIRRACRLAVDAGYRNIDIDSSTLVDLSKPTLDEQQRENYTRAAIGGTGAVKCGGNYAASLRAQAEAIEHGCDQVVFLDAVEYAKPLPVSKNTAAWNTLETNLLPSAFDGSRPVDQVTAELAKEMDAALAKE